ncbi:glycosyl transferase, family 14 [Artemisia annua]|uniref:Glycosyl transferase, family 14 n=1 Tax=Artemisia annua TaxID=35608 RepID=A0A2U1KB16_ARTAN|nr:glycosyl transferase, family 14 [Artemisia annua]
MGEFTIVARPFKNENEALLQEIDNNILNRSANGVVPGKWSLEHTTNNVTGNNGNKQREGRRWGDINSVKSVVDWFSIAVMHCDVYSLGTEHVTLEKVLLLKGWR